MSARRRIRDDIGMNLFPFMAVLICTMGALIMLLVVMVQQARVRASAPVMTTTATPDEAVAITKAVAAPEPAAVLKPDPNEALRQQNARQALVNAEIEAMNQQRLAEHEAQRKLAEEQQQQIEDYRWETSLLTQSYEQTVEQLAEQRLALSHLESHTRELSEQATAMQEEANLIATAASDEAADKQDADQDLLELREKIETAKTEIDDLRDKLANQPKKYSLIPYEGPNGTSRPPMYIECLVNQVVLRPENVVLLGEDFRAPIDADNPLAAALRAKREYLLNEGILAPGTEPYPLLVVRPGAATTYAAARSAMKSWESEFGYELVESSVELDYQDADPRLSQLLEDVVLEVRDRRRMMQAALQARKPVRQELLRPSAQGGFETVRSGIGSRSRSTTSGFGADGSGFGGFGRGGQEGSGRFGNGNTSSAATGNTNFAAGNSGNYGQGSRYGDSGRYGEATNRFDGGMTSNTSSERSQNGSSNPAGRYSSISDPVGQMGQTGQNRGQGSSDFDGRGRFGQGRADGDAAGSNDRMTANGMTGSEAGKGGGGGSSTTATGSGGKGATGAGGSSSGGGNPSGSASGSPSSGMTASNDFNTMQSLASRRGSNWALPDSRSSAVGIKRPINVICNPNAILLVPEKGTRQELQIFRHDGSVQAVVDPFVDAVRSRLDSWGIAGQGIYWRPVLQIQVQQRADGNYRQLFKLLENSGIEVTREP